MAPLTVDPAALDGAGSAVISVGQGLGSVISTLTTALGGCSGMAGDDPAGAKFGQSYNNSAAKLLEAMATTRNGLCRLGDGVRMSAHNYSMAEANSNISGHSEPLPVPPSTGPVSAGSTPSAIGSGVGAPAGWGWVAPFIGMIWPNGDSAKLRAAAAAWISAGTNFEVSEITGAVGPMGAIGAQQIPEGPAIAAAFGDVSRSAAGILQQSVSIAAQLTAYAAKIDEVHARILDLLSRICDPMTGFKEVWDILTDQDEDEIKKIANDIRVIVNQFTTEVDALRQQIATAVTEAETILTVMGRYAEKEWDHFLHGTPVGRAINQVGQFGKGVVEEGAGLVKDGWTYGAIRPFVDPQGWANSWSQMLHGMAPLVGLGGDHAPGVGQAWKDLGKNAVHWDEWKTNPAEAAGKSTFDIASLFVPGGGEGAAAAKGARAAADAAEAAAKTAPREVEALPRALGDMPKSAPHLPEAKPPAAPHAPEPHDPAPHAEVPGGRPEPAPQPKDAPTHPDPSPHSPVESKPPMTGAPLHDEGPRPPVEPSDPGHGPPPPGGGSPPPPGQGPPPPGPPHPSDEGFPPSAPPAEPPPSTPPSPGEGPPPPAEPHPPAAASPPGEGPPPAAEPHQPAAEPHQPAAASPPGEGPPPAAEPHQPTPSTPPGESHLPPADQPRPAASVPSGEGRTLADSAPQLATIGSNLAHLPLGEEAVPAAALSAHASAPAGAQSAELAPKAAHTAEPGSAVSPGRPSSLPAAGPPHERPVTHTPSPRDGSPAEPPAAARPHSGEPGGHAPAEPPHSGAPPSDPHGPRSPGDDSPTDRPHDGDHHDHPVEPYQPSDVAVEAAHRTYERAATAEPEISRGVVDAVRDTGGHLERFESRLKEIESLARKLDGKLEGVNPSDFEAIQAAENKINDAVRYTAVVPAEGYWAHGDAVIKALEGRGFTLTKDPGGWDVPDVYRGRNLTFQTPDGVKFEVQIHTGDSLSAAERTHRLYEEQRLPTTSAERRAELEHLQAEIFNSVAIPDGTPLRWKDP